MSGRAPPPDLDDPVQRAAYQAELRMVARPVRWMGLGLALAGAALATLRARLWPHVPMVVPLFLVGMAALHLAAGVVIRMKYHQRRMGRG